MFRDRFCEHLKNVTHGLYTAIECHKDEDLLQKYAEICCKGTDADQTKEWLCYHPKKCPLKQEALEKYVDDIKKEANLALKNFLNCRFLFAEIICNGKPADSSLRKEIEAIFMKKIKANYKQPAGKELDWVGFPKGRTKFWGCISKHNVKNCRYNFTNTGENPDEVLKDIGIEGNKWDYLEK